MVHIFPALRSEGEKKMSIVSGSIHPFSSPTSSRAHLHFHPNQLMSRRQRSSVFNCCKRSLQNIRSENYYELLGVSINSNPKEIKEAYRKLQKKYHPDIAGQKGHEYTIKLNEAYRVLMREDMRRVYDASSTGTVDGSEGMGISGLGYSSWKGPLRSQALFVDENKCIGQSPVHDADHLQHTKLVKIHPVFPYGCRECVHNASNTFMMDEAQGCARVKVQFGDDDKKIEVSVDSCPVNCIHWVDREELPVLEFLIRPQPLDAHGIFGGGWGRPSNVFMAAKFFTKQLKQQDLHNKGKNVEEETPAQAKARDSASMKIQMEKFSRIWSWMKDISSFNK